MAEVIEIDWDFAAAMLIACAKNYPNEVGTAAISADTAITRPQEMALRWLEINQLVTSRYLDSGLVFRLDTDGFNLAATTEETRVSEVLFHLARNKRDQI